MSKFVKWLENWLPTAWGCLWMVIITGWSIGATVWVIKWILELLEVA